MRKFYISFFAILLSIIMSASVFATSLNDAKKELDEISKNIKETKNELNEVKEEQDNVRKQLDEIEKELEAKEKELATVEKKLAQTQAELDNVRQELAETEEELLKTQERLEQLKTELDEATRKAEEQEQLNAERLRAMYMNSTSSYLKLLLEAKSLNDLLNRIDMIIQMVTYDQQVFDKMVEYRNEVEEKTFACARQEEQITQIKNEIENKKVLLEQKEKEIKDTKNKIKKQKAAIEAAQNEKEALLNQLSEEEAKVRRELEQMEKESKELEKLIKELTKKSQSSNPPNKNGYVWPAPGYTHITSPFGYRVHPITKQYKMHKGIDISGSDISNKPAVAAADGTVILSQYYGTYGYCVIIDHGGGISTLYAHGWSTTVSAGQKVKRGDTVLKIGSTGSSTGPHLHFEVRKNGEPVNPLNYVSP
ncbi:MAG TPA: peptidoglycan DD-metalloendopeptidase family protein [Clostridiales bacterium]|nr:peptidoglycan DD-metalloendopeptidase family protein [Clostridiales bacterium]